MLVCLNLYDFDKALTKSLTSKNTGYKYPSVLQ